MHIIAIAELFSWAILMCCEEQLNQNFASSGPRHFRLHWAILVAHVKKWSFFTICKLSLFFWLFPLFLFQVHCLCELFFGYGTKSGCFAVLVKVHSWCFLSLTLITWSLLLLLLLLRSGGLALCSVQHSRGDSMLSLLIFFKGNRFRSLDTVNSNILPSVDRVMGFGDL